MIGMFAVSFIFMQNRLSIIAIMHSFSWACTCVCLSVCLCMHKVDSHLKTVNVQSVSVLNILLLHVCLFSFGFDHILICLRPMNHFEIYNVFIRFTVVDLLGFASRFCIVVIVVAEFVAKWQSNTNKTQCERTTRVKICSPEKIYGNRCARSRPRFSVLLLISFYFFYFFLDFIYLRVTFEMA